MLSASGAEKSAFLAQAGKTTNNVSQEYLKTVIETERGPTHHLLVIEDNQGKRTLALKAATCSMGRDSANSIVLNSNFVSRQHAILLRVTTPNTSSYLFRIIDGNLQGKRSSNGLIINGKRCFSHDLKHGDLIVFGTDVKVRYYATANPADLELLTDCQPEELSSFLSNLSNPSETFVNGYAELEQASDAALVRLASFPELVSNPIVEINLTGSLTYLNPAAVGQFPDMKVAGLQHPILLDLLSTIATTQNKKKKTFVREVKIGDQIFEQSVHYIAESELIRSYIFDITDRKRVEKALQEAHDKLETRVEERTAELKAANEQLRNQEVDVRNALEKEKELGELKSRFVTMASHEFRTPLATILSSTELLEHYSYKWGEEKKLTHYQRIQVAVQHMTGLLNDVLLIGKADAGKLEFKPTPLDLDQFSRDLVEAIQTTTRSHLIVFCRQGQCQNTVMDQKLLRHILSNLLSNAIKYSPQAGTVHFDLVCESGQATFQVRDQGIGIPAVDQAQLFNSFHRASNVGTIAGTGLGLTIVKKSVEIHGGTIALKSEVGVGTTFTVSLPVNKPV